LSTKLEHARNTPKAPFLSTSEKIRLHLYCHGAVVDAQLGLDCKPHRYVGGSLEDLSTHDSAGALERSTEWHVDGALAIGDGVKRESKLSREGHVAQQLLTLRALHANAMKTSVLEEEARHS
jgi:hypothetical protein